MLSSGCPSSTRRWFGFQPNTKAATLVFGFFHGFGLSIKIIKYEISTNGLVTNLLAFNVGGEIGQLLNMLLGAQIWAALAPEGRTDLGLNEQLEAFLALLTR